MLHTTKGIVFHHFKYSEKSVIAKIYTQKFGLQSYIINGVRGKKSKSKLAYLQPLSLLEINAYHKENKGLQQVKDIKLSLPFQNIPFNVYKSSIAFFIAEILYKSIKEEEANNNLFDFLYNSIQILDLDEESYMNFHLLFLSQLTKHLGFFPHHLSFNNQYFDLQEGISLSQPPPHQDYIKPPISNLLQTIFGSNFEDIKTLKIDNNNRKLLLTALIDYYALHLSNFGNLKSKEILEEILS